MTRRRFAVLFAVLTFAALLAPAAALATGAPGSASRTNARPLEAGVSPVGADGASAAATGVRARVIAGANHSCLLAVDGSARCWGDNGDGQLGNGSTVDAPGPVRVLGVLGIASLAGGVSHTCAVLGNGTARCWGQNTYGQLGNGSTTRAPIAVAVSGLSNVVQIDAGPRHSCALLADGTIRCWGNNEFGQLGDGTTNDSTTPVMVAGISGARAITAGGRHTCALLADGSVKCWGRGVVGELGNGTFASSPTPQPVSGLSDVTAIDSMGFFTCALRAAGTVACWGTDAYWTQGSQPSLGLPVTIAGLTSVRALSAGATFACAIRGDATMACWGQNAFGQQTGSTDFVYPPATAQGLAGVVDVAAGIAHTCVRLVDETVRCFGANDQEQIGGATPAQTNVPRIVAGNLGTPEVSAGGSHSCAMTLAGTVQCWGDNSLGQLGIDSPSTTGSMTPRTVVGLTGVIRISAGTNHTCAIKSDGTVWCWGSNATGQLGNTTVATGTAGKSYKPVQAQGVSDPVNNPAVDVSAGGDQTCIVLKARSAACWGGDADGQIGDGGYGPGHFVTQPSGLPGLDAVVAISAGSGHTCAVLADGRAACWGANGSGQLGSGSFSPRETSPKFVQQLGASQLADMVGVVGISARYGYTCALSTDGKVRCWGWNGYGQLGGQGGDTPYANEPAISSVSQLGPSSNHGVHTCVVVLDGSVRCWGANTDGQLGFGQAGSSYWNPVVVVGVTSAVEVSVGFEHTCVLLRSGTARCWGLNGSGQLGNGSSVTPQPSPVAVSTYGAGVRAIGVDAGASHTCAVVSNATAKCWGAGGSGRLGTGSTSNRTTPGSVSGLSGATAISAGGGHSCAILAAGTARCWGSNAYGQLGNNSTTSRTTPQTVSGLAGVIAISAGGNHSCALLSNGTVKCWGLNSSGQLGDGTTTSRHLPVAVKISSTTVLSGVVAISAGASHTCAVLSNGTARCWGAGANGRIGNGSTANRLFATAVSGVTSTTAAASRFASISAGGAHTCARLANGTAKCWGAGSSGRLGNGSTSDHSTPVTVSGLTSVAQISAGGAHTCALLANGTPRCWGADTYGQLGINSTSPHSTPVTVSALSGATSVSAGGNHTAATVATGGLRAWGLNSSGQVGDGTTTNRLMPRGVSGF